MTDACLRGHPYTEDNTRWRVRVRPGRKTTTTRICRPCEAQAARESYDRRSWREVHRLYLLLLDQRGVTRARL